MNDLYVLPLILVILDRQLIYTPRTPVCPTDLARTLNRDRLSVSTAHGSPRHSSDGF